MNGNHHTQLAGPCSQTGILHHSSEDHEKYQPATIISAWPTNMKKAKEEITSLIKGGSS